jgi:hypothetical protein
MAQTSAAAASDGESEELCRRARMGLERQSIQIRCEGSRSPRTPVLANINAQ